MKGAAGTGLVVVGFILLYLAITDKLDCLFAMFDCMFGTSSANASNAARVSPTSQPNAVGKSTAFGWHDFRV